MVSRHLFAAWLFLLLPGVAVAASVITKPVPTKPMLHLMLDKKEVQLGHHIQAELYGIDLAGKLGNIDLQALDAEFGVVLEETVEAVEDQRWPVQPVQKLLLKLYPRQSGVLVIPAFAFVGAHSLQQSVTVTPGINKSRQGDSQIERRITISSTQPWQRQQVVIEMDIVTNDSFATLRAAEPEIAGFEVFALPPDREKFHRDGLELNRLHIGWVLFPLASGYHRIELPPIEYRKSGRSARVYYLPKLALQVRTLPPYIPPTMPVGRVDISSTLESTTWLYPQTLSFWHITLTGAGVSPNLMPPLLRHIRSDEAIRFLPAKSKHTVIPARDGLQSQITHHIPFKPSDNGRVNLPTLRLQYFDPDSGKILATTLQPPFAFSLSLTWRAILISLSGTAILLVGKTLYSKLRQLTRRRRLRQAALTGIATADSAMDLRKALNLFSEAEGWPTNMTLRDWTRHWTTRHHRSDNFDTLMQQLSVACYGETPSIELEELRRALLAQLR